MTTDTSTRIDTLELYVGRTAAALQSGYLADRPDAGAKLARLRRALTAGRHLSPDAWDIFEGMPEQLLGAGDEPSEAEFAAVAALTLFATHQQSRRDAGMHRQGRGHTLGRSVARLAATTDSKGVERRFRALTRSNDIGAGLQYLRGLVTQLRGERIALDYGALARDLYNMQYPEGIHAVRMRWTRDYHRPTNDAGRSHQLNAEAATTDPTGETP
ncbi:type I-E CRISPR-associated protein Cse2/CasB [Nocardioides immobilis]|uniref:Type I-E CRISPR-associated protein Cse2/CasB n=1 Tax=Nocardioides immobilis TaxID=2049295 RepID=A0A417XZL6_9ACTN|nr:type I-E CRISPR-associated protein Cse2/CasB [Nocardioides immobilis]RHW25832.1 type I-E CRISPR-associated protein Cse2/CasB [Nocardioides immobilis]